MPVIAERPGLLPRVWCLLTSRRGGEHGGVVWSRPVTLLSRVAVFAACVASGRRVCPTERRLRFRPSPWDWHVVY